jgi:hypothetical protein
MDRWGKIYEISVVCLSICIVLFTIGTIWFSFINGVIFNKPVEFNDPHPFEYPIGGHVEKPARDITHLTVKNFYKPGEMVTAYVDVNKHTNIPGSLQWQLMDRRFYPYVSRKGVLLEGHTHQIVNIERIPLHVPPGQYHFSGSVSYDMPLGPDVHIPLRTNCFQIIDENKPDYSPEH